MIYVTSAQYQLDVLKNWSDYCKKINQLILESKARQTNLLLLSEYAGCEIACGQYDTDLKLYQSIQPTVPYYLDFYSALSKKYHVYIQPGTIPIEVAPNQFVNRAFFFSPSGEYGFQDKLKLTTYEKLSKVMVSGKEQMIFNTSLGKVGIAICYDAEFPELVRSLALAGAKLILIPSYTDSAAGAARVFYCARARAIENQCYVATSPVVGPMMLTQEIDHCQGVAAILGPADMQFPANGILAQAETEGTTLLTANLDFNKIDWVRKHGSVQNFLDTDNCSTRITNVLSL